MTTTIEPSAAHLTLDHVGHFTDGDGQEYVIGHLSVLNGEGDTRVMWDSRNKAEREAAKEQFEKLTSQGYLAYQAEGKKGTQGEQIKKFDPKAERIIFVRPTQGG